MGIERTLRRSIDRAFRRKLAAKDGGKRSGRAAMPVDKLTEAANLRKIVSGNMASASDEFQALISTGKYDRCVAEAKWHVESGRKIVNIVCPGYQNEPAASIVNFIVNSAMHSDGVKIKNGLSEAVVRTVDVESGVDVQEYERKNVAAVSDAIFGSPMFNHLSPNNLIARIPNDELRDYAREKEIDLNTISKPDLYRLMSINRKNDIVYNPDDPMSYTYLCGSVEKGAINYDVKEIEAEANRLRIGWKTGSIALEKNALAEIDDDMVRINDTLAIPGSDMYFPYRGAVTSKSTKGMVKLSAISREVVGDPDFGRIYESARESGVDVMEAKYTAAEYVGGRVRNSAFLIKKDGGPEDVSVNAGVILTDDEVRLSFPDDGIYGRIVGVSVSSRLYSADDFSKSKVVNNVWLRFPRESQVVRDVGRAKNVNITLRLAANTTVFDAEYGSNKDKILDIQSKLGIKINRGPLPNWAPDLYDYRGFIPFDVGHGNNLYHINIAYNKRLRARDFLREKMNIEKAKAGQSVFSCALGHLENEISEIEAFLKEAVKVKKEIPPSDKNYDSSSSLLRYSSKDARWLADEIVDECRKAKLNIPRFGGMLNENLIAGTLSGDDRTRFMSIISEVRKRHGIESSHSYPSAVMIRGMDAASKARTGNGLVDIVTKPGDNSTTEMDISQNMKDMMARYVAASSVYAKDRSAMFLVTEIPIPEKVTESISVGIVYVDVSIISESEIRQYINLFVKKSVDAFVAREKDESKNALAKTFFLPETFAMKFGHELAGLSSHKVKLFIESKVRDLLFDYVAMGGNMDKMIDSNESKIKSELFAESNNMGSLDSIHVEVKTPAVKPHEYLSKTGTDWNKFVEETFGSVLSRLRVVGAKTDALCRMYDCRVAPVKMVGNVAKLFLEASGKEVVLVKVVNGKPSASAMSDSFVSKFRDSYGNTFSVRDYKDGDVYSEESHPAMMASLLTALANLRSEAAKIKREIRPLLFLYGPAGSGKTIFGDVLANAFGLKYHFCKLSDVYNAGRNTMFRGQSENNLHEFFSHCRNCNDMVMVIDEFNKTFEGEGEFRGSSDMSKKVLDSLMGALEEDKGVYVSNGVYIVMTSNKSPEWLKAHTEAEPFFSRSNQIGAAYEVEVPNDFESIKKLFLTDALVNNMISNVVKDNALADVIAMTIRAKLTGDNDKYAALSRKLIEMDKNILDKGILYPKDAKKKYMESVGVFQAENLESTNLQERIDDFIDGFIMMKQLFQRMEKTPPGKSYSYLDMIAHRMRKQMVWGKGVGKDKKELPKTGVRDINGMLIHAFTSHQKFMSGNKSAIPLNAQNMFFAASLSEWTSVPDEFKNHPDMIKQKQEGAVSQREGWKALERIASSSDIGLSKEFFYSNDDHEYVLDMVRQSTEAIVGVGDEFDEKKFMIQYEAKVLDKIFVLNDQRYEEKIGEVLGLLRNVQHVPDYNIAEQYLSEMNKLRSRVKEAIDNLNKMLDDSLASLKVKRKSIEKIKVDIHCAFVSALAFADNNHAAVKSVYRAANDYLNNLTAKSAPGWIKDVCEKFSGVMAVGDVFGKLRDAFDKRGVSAVVQEKYSGVDAKKAAEMRKKAAEIGIHDQIFTGQPTEEMISWLNSRSANPAVVVKAAQINDVAAADEALENRLIDAEDVSDEEEAAVDEEVVDKADAGGELPTTEETSATDLQPQGIQETPAADDEMPIGDLDDEEAAVIQEQPAPVNTQQSPGVVNQPLPEVPPAQAENPAPEPVPTPSPSSSIDDGPRRPGESMKDYLARIKKAIAARESSKAKASTAARLVKKSSVETVDADDEATINFLNHAGMAVQMLSEKRGIPTVSDDTGSMMYIKA